MARELPRVSLVRATATLGVLLVGAPEVRSQPACTYTLSPGGAVVQNTGGSGLVSVATTASCSWQPQSLAPWISTMGSGVGNGSVSYYVGANTSGTVRYGSINIAGQTFTITQPGAPCTYSLSPTSAALPTAGGSGLVSVTTPNGCPWQATSQAPWISTIGGGSGSGSFSFSVAPNPTPVQRIGTIAVAGQTFTVTQAPLCTHSLSPTSASAASGGGSATFNVSAPAACSWQAVSQVSWIHVAGTGSGSGGGSVTYSVDPNPAAAARSGSIVVAGQTFTVTQAAAPCIYSLSPTGVQVGSGGSGGTFSVTSPIGCAWQATSQASWIHVAGTGSGSGGGSVTYSVDANPAGVLRAGSIAVANQTFAITQAGVPCTYSLSPTHADLGSGFGGGTFSVTAPAGCAWQATSQASWIGTTSSGTGSGSVIYSVPPNTAGTPRSGTIAVAGQSFTVSQAAAPCTYSLSPTQADVGSGGDSGTVSITTPAGCAWQATSQASWITATGSGTGSGSFTYAVAANAAVTARSGAIAVAGQSFTVSQAAAPCTYSLSPTHADVGSGGGGGTLSVTAPTGCTWHATSQAAWIGTTSSGDGNGDVAYSVDANGDTSSRSGAIDVAGQSFTVSQDATAAPTDTLRAGERLYPDQALRSGRTMLLYQRDNNLVLYQDGAPLWASMAGIGNPTNRFEMQTDCNAVVYGGYGFVWASGTSGQGSACQARVIEGDWFICSGSNRVFSARGGGFCPTDESSAMLRQGESLYPGQCRRSPSGQVRLCLQADGDLVIQQDGNTIFAADTAGSPGRATLQSNGSLVVYNAGGGVAWETGDVSVGLKGPAALLVLDEADVVIDQEDNLEAAPSKPDGPCLITLHSRAADQKPVGIHDVMRIDYGNGRVVVKSMQDDEKGCEGVTCNDTRIGDGCPPGGDDKEPFHDTRQTWDRRMSREACEECAKAYDRTIGYAYKLGDSNGAVNDCVTAAQGKISDSPLTEAQRMQGAPPPLESLVKLWKVLRVHSKRFGRYYELPTQRGESPEKRCEDAVGPERNGCNQIAQSSCPTVCGPRAPGGRFCAWCPSASECQVTCSAASSATPATSSSGASSCGCTPTTSCDQMGAQCGTISNGCEPETCTNRCYPGQGCVDNLCCTRAQGECGRAYDECSRQYVDLGGCSSEADECVNNWCQRMSCIDSCRLSCPYWANWCATHENDSSCCKYY